MVLEIGEKLGPTTDPGVGAAPTSSAVATIREPVEAALEQLGWPRAVASRTLDQLPGEFTSVEEMLRAALAVLGAQRGF